MANYEMLMGIIKIDEHLISYNCIILFEFTKFLLDSPLILQQTLFPRYQSEVLASQCLNSLQAGLQPVSKHFSAAVCFR